MTIAPPFNARPQLSLKRLWRTVWPAPTNELEPHENALARRAFAMEMLERDPEAFGGNIDIMAAMSEVPGGW